jgi:hypothetical protein
MPSNVTWFERLMYVGVLLGLADIYLTARYEQMTFPSTEAWLTIGTGAILAAVYVWLIWLVARKRKGWVRYVLVALFVLGVVAVLMSLSTDVREHPLGLTVNVLSSLAEGIALYLAFTGNARPWFTPAISSAPG